MKKVSILIQRTRRYLCWI